MKEDASKEYVMIVITNFILFIFLPVVGKVSTFNHKYYWKQ